MRREQIIYENQFNLETINKFASLMTVGNGFLGVRATHEEDYTEQTRGMYVAGIYNKALPNETSDLVNLPDLVGVKIKLDGQLFSLLDGEILSYERTLNLFNGELKREVMWMNKDEARFKFIFQRFVAKDKLHVLASKITIISLDKEVDLQIVTGINAQQTNFGRQHIIEEKLRIFEEKYMQGIYTTTESGHTVALATSFLYPPESKVSYGAKNRQLQSTFDQRMVVGNPYVFEKVGTVFTSLNTIDVTDLDKLSLNSIKHYASQGYDLLLTESALKWKEFWGNKRIQIHSTNKFDQQAIDFALYQLEIMTPAHDERFSVGAKGLTGEGYKGHIFWDTEIFIKPFHLLNEPKTAKQLLRYRYLKLEQAKEKAIKNGYSGALFPWESAFSGEEETPEYAAINIKTGERQKVASALAEHHIVADIAYAVVNYYQATLDDEFMKKEGLALLKETSRFWISRATEDKGKLVINNVIGPDEYTEHINNNAYTNYMAYYNVEQALYFMAMYDEVDDLLVELCRDFLDRIYLPRPNDNNIIPQDDTFLDKPEIDLTSYKKKQGSQSILLDYSRKEVNEMQILKQADVVMLLYLFPDLFSKDVILDNLHYYEQHTIHDSSLSKAIHAIVAARCGEITIAYKFFKEACLIDLGPNPKSSDEGIHAASLGAIWLAIVYGFANITFKKDRLALNPKLPAEWEEIQFPIQYRRTKLSISLTKNKINITKVCGPDLIVEIGHQEYLLTQDINVNL